jgi:hypothetical protein
MKNVSLLDVDNRISLVFVTTDGRLYYHGDDILTENIVALFKVKWKENV